MRFKMMKKMPRVAAMGTAVLMLAGMLPTVAMANNHEDDPWVFNVSAQGGKAYVSPANRNKLDNTSSYMKCDTFTQIYIGGSGDTYVGTVHGSKGIKLSDGLSDVYYGSRHSTSYTFKQGTVKYMTNFLYEAGYEYANIYCDAKYTTYAKFTGVWSPDSI